MSQSVKDTISEYRKISSNLLKNHVDLRNFCSGISPKDLAENLSEEDGLKLEELMHAGVNGYYFFEVMLHYNRVMAESFFTRFYIGIYVSPDRKGGGYESMISSMMEDYCDLLGVDDLKRFLLSDSVSYRRLLDTRVVRSLSEILEVEEDCILAWIKKNKSISPEEEEYMVHNDLIFSDKNSEIDE